MQETNRPAPLLFTRNRQARTDDDPAEDITVVRLDDGSDRFHCQVRVFEFRVPGDSVKGRGKATRRAQLSISLRVSTCLRDRRTAVAQ
jgi:hypothetical protein